MDEIDATTSTLFALGIFERLKSLWTGLRALLAKLVGLLVSPGPTKPRVDSIEPGDGWPGTTLTINGVGFSPARDDNLVSIGGDRALVIAASDTELRVLAGEGTVTGPVVITTAAGSGTSTDPFTVRPWPEPDDVAASGAPLFFHGPQEGTPAIGMADQPVLVVLAYPTDHDPGTTAQRTVRRSAEEATFADARRFWDEATYGATSWAYTSVTTSSFQSSGASVLLTNSKW